MLLSVEETPKLSSNHQFALDLLKKMYIAQTGEEKLPNMLKTKEGKPFFSHSPYYFNISHSKNKVAVALGKVSVGIDIQVITKPSQRVISRVCSRKEQNFIEGSANQNKAFTLLWVGKEAFFKENGEGIGSGKKLAQLEILPTFLQGQTGFETFYNLGNLNSSNLQKNKIKNKYLLRFSKDDFCVGLCTGNEQKSIKLFSCK